MVNIKSINRLIISEILLLIFIVSFFSFITINYAYEEFKDKVNIIKTTFLDKQKESVKTSVEDNINFMKYIYTNYSNLPQQEIEKKILKGLDEFNQNNKSSEYVFVYNYKGIKLYDSYKKDFIKENHIDAMNKDGIRVIEKLITISKEKEGGYLKYLWGKPNSSTEVEKITFVKAFNELNWVVGKGVYLDDINSQIEQKEIDYYNKISKYIFPIVLLIIFIIFNAIFLYKYTSKLIIKEIKMISGFFEKGINEVSLFNHQDIYFKEFKPIAKYANELISKVKLNTKNLEDQVLSKEAELELLLKNQEEFIKKSIHEINTPLTIIQMNIDLLKMKHDDKYVTNIETGSKIIYNIYNDLSYLVKKNIIEYKKSHIDFTDFLNKRIEFFNQIAVANKLFFVTNIQNKVTIKFNDTELQRIIDNNISNAIKYSFKDSPIFITLMQNSEIVFEVKSLSKEIQDKERIFTNYYRENNSRGGFGLGLNIVKEICDKNYVTIELISNKKETKFIYRFKNENITA